MHYSLVVHDCSLDPSCAANYALPSSLPLCLLELINPLGDEADLERVDVPNPRWFLGMISQPILIIMMNTIYHQLLTPHKYLGN